MGTYTAYGARARPDSYPHTLYRARSDQTGRVERCVYGQWAVEPAVDRLVLRGKVERGELTELPPDWAEAVDGSPVYLKQRSMVINASDAVLRKFAMGDIYGSLSHDPVWVRSISYFEQTGSWQVVERGCLSCEKNAFLSLAQCSTEVFSFPSLASNAKRYREILAEPWGPGGPSIEIGSVPRGATELRSAIQAAAAARLTSLREQQEQQERAAENERRRIGEARVRRLSELSARSTTQLTSAEYQEKMKLKREMTNVSR